LDGGSVLNEKQVAQEIIKLAKEISGADKTPAQEQLEKAIRTLSYIPISYAFADRRKGQEMKKRINKIVDALEDILMEIPSPVEYQAVGVGGDRVKEFDDVKDLIRYLKSKGHKQTGYETGGHLRPILQGQPKFDGLHGPMYGGPKKVRYETWEVYEQLSK
jgi:hypothetical protein